MKENKNLMNEKEIVCKAQQGDVEALNVLLKHYQKLAHYIALKICHCDADAEDIVQESFIEVQRSIKGLNEPAYFKAWLNRIIFSKATKLFRKNKDVVLPGDDLLFQRESQEQRRYMLPDKKLKFDSDLDVLRYYIGKLPEKFRMIIYLKYFEQLSINEIAIACDIPEGTVKSRLNYARKELKGTLSTYEQENDTKLDFSLRGLETVLLSVFAKESAQYLPFVVAPKGFSFSLKGHVIEPSMMLMASIATVTTVGVTAVALPYLEKAFSNDTDTIVNPLQDVSTNHKSFPSIIFQGKTITSEKEAYQALTTFAHCHVELEKFSTQEQDEAKEVYTAMEKNGGAYYELLKNRGYLGESYEK